MMLRRIKVAAADDWRAAEAYLKLTRPEIFKRPPQPQQQNHLHVHGDTKVTLSIERQQEIREQNARIRATIHDTVPKASPRIQPSGFLVGPDEREALPVKEAEVVEEQAQQQAAQQEIEAKRSEIARKVWNTYSPNKDENSGDDIF